MSENSVTPAYREERLLANIAGGDYEITPATRKEKLLSEIQGFISEIQGILDEIQGLPDTTGAQEGDVLTIGNDGPEWAEAPQGLPDTTGAQEGDVLTIGSVGAEWAAPASGGGGLLVAFTGVYDSVTEATTFTGDQTYGDFIACLESGIMPLLRFTNNPNNIFEVPPGSYMPFEAGMRIQEGSESYIAFYGPDVGRGYDVTGRGGEDDVMVFTVGGVE